jgi:hypothetical protein
MQTGGAPGATDNSSTSSPQYGGMPNEPSGTGQDIVDWLKSVVAAFNASAGTHLTVTAGATHLLGWMILAATIIPLADAAIVAGHGGPKSIAYGVHGLTAAVMLITSALLLIS